MTSGLRPFPADSISRQVKRHFQHWVSRRMPPARRIVLDHHNIFILPSRQGLVFCLVLLLMFIAAVNYELSLGFALVFLLTGMFVLSILYTFRNLSGLHISANAGPPVFAGENSSLDIVLNRYGTRTHEALELSFENSGKAVADLLDDSEHRASLYIPTTRRGLFSPGRLRITTFFPFGLCRAWSLPDLQVTFLVYPKPIACDLAWMSNHAGHQGHNNPGNGHDDFYGLRDYQHGDSLHHVAWKSVARGQGMFTKQFVQHVDESVWLDWDMFPGMNMEDRLSRLCYCVLKLEPSGLDYGLVIPGIRVDPGRGAQHYGRVLETLALYRLADEGAA
ncbi:MAG: DUF58 domain-containing protein [Pseudomonadales bacterium]|nr:DUF58 domain-containing protein [Pseudomonadales bacterium]